MERWSNNFWLPLEQFWELDETHTQWTNIINIQLIASIIIISLKTRYDYNLTITKSPKPATDNRFKK